MINIRAIFFVIVLVALAASAFERRAPNRALAAPTASEFRVSPAADPDPRDETSIAESPLDDRVLVGASKVIAGGATGNGVSRVAYYYSSDAGQTWGTGLLPLETPQKVWNRASDPSVIADADGNFFVCVLMLDESSGTFDSGVYLFKSVDGGRTFGPPVPITFDVGSTSPKTADKCYITVDVNSGSPFKNTIYATWVSTEPTRVVVVTSFRRPGESGFSQPIAVSHSGTMKGPSIAVGPNGELYVAWQGIGVPRVILFNASTDGGQTFFPPVIARPDRNVHDFIGSLTNEADAAPAIIVNGVPRMNSFPVIDVDRSNGPNRGMIYLAWAETTNHTDSDIFVERLTPPLGVPPEVVSLVRVNTDNGFADQFLPWLSVDPASGAVEVAFYDRRDTSDGLSMNAYVARSTDGGLHFDDNIRVSGAPSNPDIQSRVHGSFQNEIGIGDYIGLIASRGKAHMLWTDTRAGKQEIFYGSVQFEPSGGGGGGGGGGQPPANDSCQSSRVIAALPFSDNLDTTPATSAADPVSCSGGQDSNSVWYSVTAAADTTYGIDSLGSNFDTVLSVYDGSCATPNRVACNDDFAGTRSLLTFAARSGVTYLIEASGKSAGGLLELRAGYPTITACEYTNAPNGSQALRITGASFVSGDATVVVEKQGVETNLPNLTFSGVTQSDGTTTSFFASKKKLKKLIKRGNTVIVRIESPAGSGRFANAFTFTR